MATYLDRILVAHRAAAHGELRSLASLVGLAAAMPPARGFRAAIVASPGLAVIAEIKRRSPSKVDLNIDLDPAGMAMTYEDGGAACLSVLTNAPHFQGSRAHLEAARAAVDLPVLRKDFILDPWQVYESRAMGADCILLILAALTDREARDLEELARALDMDVLVEVHDEREVERALGLETPLFGINNRNLKTLVTDIATTERLAPLVPPDRFLIAESGIRGNADLRRLSEACVQCFLVGESLLRQPDVAAATRALLTDAP